VQGGTRNGHAEQMTPERLQQIRELLAEASIPPRSSGG
jgi:hypothetical protein